MSVVRILRGDCRDVLKTLQDQSVQCVATSPPYWGLRDYGIPPSVWGGNPDCEHEWGDHIAVNATNHTTKARWNHTRNGRDELQPVEKRVAWLRPKVKQGQFCQKCNAWAGALGLEPTHQMFVEHIVDVFRDVWRVLRDDGVCWVNLGDSYCSGGRQIWQSGASGNKGQNISDGMARAPQPADLKPKDLVGVPWRCAFALQDDGWFLRRDVIWSKPNPMPESCTDRPTTAHEYVFLMTKRARYFYDAEAVREVANVQAWDDGSRVFGGKNKHGANIAHGNRTTGRPATASTRKVKVPGGWDRGEGAHGTIHRDGRTEAEYQEVETKAGRNLRSVWTIATQPFSEAHFATFPPKLAETCILAGTSEMGACPACGAPWARTITKGEPDEAHRASCGADASGGYNGQSIKNHDAAGVQNASDVKRRILEGLRKKTYGWQPTCDCPGADPIPCVVLDPFGGAGTVGLVADRLQRDAILIELNPAYAKIAERRVTKDAGLFAEVSA